MRRVAYISADQGVPVFGRKGCSIHVQEVIRAFSGMGMEIDLFTARPEGTPPSGLNSVVLHKLPSAGGSDRAAPGTGHHSGCFGH